MPITVQGTTYVLTYLYNDEKAAPNGSPKSCRPSDKKTTKATMAATIFSVGRNMSRTRIDKDTPGNGGRYENCKTQLMIVSNFENIIELI